MFIGEIKLHHSFITLHVQATPTHINTSSTQH